MTPELGALIVFGIGLLTALVWWLVRPLTPRERLRDLSLIQEDRTEDQPVATIDEALAQTTDPAERDALLDVRLRAMEGAE